MSSIPFHLASWAIPEECHTDGYIFQIAVVCPCGSSRLEICHPGTIQLSNGQAFTGCFVDDNGHYFRVTAKCVACGNGLLIFDNDFHGWSGRIQPNRRRTATSRPTLRPWCCHACGAVEHRSVVRYTLPGESDCEQAQRGEYVKGNHGDFANAQRADLFVWIGMDISCCACGSFTWLWFEAETM